MAIHLNPSFRFPRGASDSQHFLFQRGNGKIRIRKAQHKFPLKFKHIVLLLFLFGGIFYSLIRLYLYLISAEQFTVRRVEVKSPQEKVQTEIAGMIPGAGLGNIFLLDISRLQHRIETHRWVKEVRVRKVFPATLEVEVREREPWAVLKKEGLFYLIDEGGVILEPLKTPVEVDLPLLTDSSHFRTDYREKLTLAGECLTVLDVEEKAGLVSLDISETGVLSLLFREEPLRLILGRDRFREKMTFFRSIREEWERNFGKPEYLDLRFFEDRVYFKPRPQPEEAHLPYSSKEVE